MTREGIDDIYIISQWKRAVRLYNKKSSLAKRIALSICDDLEKAGVTEEDVSHLFPLSPTQRWLRDEFVDPAED